MYKTPNGLLRHFYVPYNYLRERGYRYQDYRNTVGKYTRRLLNNMKPDRTNHKKRSNIFRDNVEVRHRFHESSLYDRWY